MDSHEALRQNPPKRKKLLCKGALHFSTNTCESGDRKRRQAKGVAYTCTYLCIRIRVGCLIGSSSGRLRVPYAARPLWGPPRPPLGHSRRVVIVDLVLQKNLRSMALNRENLMSSFFMGAKRDILLLHNMTEVGYPGSVQTFVEFWTRVTGKKLAARIRGWPIDVTHLFYKLDKVRSYVKYG